MPRLKVTLDHVAIRRILQAQFRPAIDELADVVAADAQSTLDRMYGTRPLERPVVDVQHQTTDRARATVAIAEANGARIEAKYGVLQDAAERNGLEVKRHG